MGINHLANFFHEKRFVVNTCMVLLLSRRLRDSCALPNFFQNRAFDDFVYGSDTQKSVGPGRGGADNNGNTPIGE